MDFPPWQNATASLKFNPIVRHVAKTWNAPQRGPRKGKRSGRRETMDGGGKSWPCEDCEKGSAGETGNAGADSYRRIYQRALKRPFVSRLVISSNRKSSGPSIPPLSRQNWKEGRNEKKKHKKRATCKSGAGSERRSDSRRVEIDSRVIWDFASGLSLERFNEKTSHKFDQLPVRDVSWRTFAHNQKYLISGYVARNARGNEFVSFKDAFRTTSPVAEEMRICRGHFSGQIGWLGVLLGDIFYNLKLIKNFHA